MMQKAAWPKRDAWFLFLGALSLRLVACFWAWGRVPPTADGAFYHVVAQRIAQGLGYTWLWPDGAVTYAAHYPVGYPTMMAPLYLVFGPVPGVVMVLNALLGALAVVAAHGICLRTLAGTPWESWARQASLVASLSLVVSPTLVGYTPALMTEGAVGAFGLFAARLAVAWQARRGASRGGLFLLFSMIVCLAVATYLRPQSILLAPVLGILMMERSFFMRAAFAAAVSFGCIALVIPWTLRNCDKMDRCVFVSANGGWNLLIGTFPEGRGAWVAVDGERVPVECREVFGEAEKDECFGQAGMRAIRSRPLGWLALVPAKLRATFDHAAAASEHLAAAGALNEPARTMLKYAEFALQRIGFSLAVFGAWAAARFMPSDVGRNRGTDARRRSVLLAVAAIGIIGFVGMSAAIGWLSVVVLLVASGRFLLRVGPGLAVATVVLTALVHGVFFGAGRYSLPLILWTAPLIALGAGAVMQVWQRHEAGDSSANSSND